MNEGKIAKWCEEQRVAYWKGELTKAQIAKLKKADFPFGNRDEYDEQELKAFKDFIVNDKDLDFHYSTKEYGSDGVPKGVLELIKKGWLARAKLRI